MESASTSGRRSFSLSDQMPSVRLVVTLTIAEKKTRAE